MIKKVYMNLPGKKSLKFINLEGKTFGNLRALEYVRCKSKNGIERWLWKCKCSCGNIVFVRTDVLNLEKGQNSCIKCANQRAADKRRKPDYYSLKKNIYDSYKYSAGRKYKRDYVFELTKEELINIIEQNCYYCGAEPREYVGDKSYLKEGEVYKHNGIDRKDNSKGYTLDNVVPCCTNCNVAKLNKSEIEFYNWIEVVYMNVKDRL